MGLRITTNVASLNAQNTLGKSQRTVEKNFAQISSGSRITKAADDAAGLSISERFKSQIRSFRQAGRNANDGISLLQIAEGGLVENSNILNRLRELAIQAASDTIGDTERGFIQKEVDQLTLEIDRISQGTKFGDVQLLNGTANVFEFHVGSGADEFVDRLTFEPGKLNSTSSNLDVEGLDYTSKDSAKDALSRIDVAQTKVNEYRSEIGAVQSRMFSSVNNLQTAEENLSAANSRIRDADIAQSTAEMATNNILLNASTSILQQANAFPAQALKLLA